MKSYQNETLTLAKIFSFATFTLTKITSYTCDNKCQDTNDVCIPVLTCAAMEIVLNLIKEHVINMIITEHVSNNNDNDSRSSLTDDDNSHKP